MPSLSATQPSEKIMQQDIPGKPCKVIEGDMLTLNKKNYVCIVDYHSKFPIVKRAEEMSAERLITACKAMFSEYGLPKKTMSDADGNFISDKFRKFFMCMNIEQVTSLSYHHQSNGQVEVCIKL